MRILGIETSCDDTAVALVRDGTIVEKALESSQANQHARYGGIVPELASRLHAEMIYPLLDQLWEETGLGYANIDAIAVTVSPGLEGALLIGVTAARAIAKLVNKPFIAVNHLHGHVYSAFLDRDILPTYPFLALVVSGGHTVLMHIASPREMTILAETLDDAAGEVFDKVARTLGLGYPGGPEIERWAQDGTDTAFHFPRAVADRADAFSFSGLKTAVLQCIQRMGTAIPIADIAASFQTAVVEALVAKVAMAYAANPGLSALVIGGGVAANHAVQSRLSTWANQVSLPFYIPKKQFCTDNAAMIAAAASLTVASKSQ